MSHPHTGPEVVEYNRGTHDQYPNQPSLVAHQAHSSDLRRSDYSNKGDRFNDYRRKNGYKYNFYSMLDEPWNRCCEFGKCGQCCPPNECIAQKVPKLDWL